MTDNDRAFWLSFRQAVLIVLGALEDRLGLERSVTPKHKRKRNGKPVDFMNHIE